MILDERGEVADDTALSTAGTGRSLVGDVIDLTADASSAPELFFVAVVSQAILSAGAATVQFVLASDAQAAIATDGTATEHFKSGAIPKAQLVPGFVVMSFKLSQLWLGPTPERFLGLLANVGTAALTAGKVNAFLTMNPVGLRSYADAIGG